MTWPNAAAANAGRSRAKVPAVTRMRAAKSFVSSSTREQMFTWSPITV